MSDKIDISEAAELLGVKEAGLYQFLYRHQTEVRQLGAEKPRPRWKLSKEAIEYIQCNFRPAKKHKGF